MKNLVRFVGILAVVILAAAQARASVYLSENFNGYADGALVGNTGSGWQGFSGTAGTLGVVSGAATLTSSLSQDAGTNFDGGTAHISDAIYASFDVTLGALPTGNQSFGGNGTYFFMFKDSGTSNFRSRVWVTTNNAASGSFRIGIANGSAVLTNTDTPNPVFVGTDLSLGTTYKIAVKLDQTGAAPVCTLWLNPTTESSANVIASDTFANTLLGVTSIALRQATATVGAGSERVDNILVGTTFADVIAVPEPSTIMLLGVGLISLFALRRRS